MKLKDIIFEFINIWASQNEIYSVAGEVLSVDESKRICSVSPNDGGANILDVKLEADYSINSSGVVIASSPKGFFLVPAVGSVVILTFQSSTDAFISAYTTVDKVISTQGEWIFNDGANGGLTKLQELTDRLNDYEVLFNQLKTDLSGWTPVPNDGGAALKALLSSGYLTKVIPNSQVSDFENEDVKH